MSVAGQWRLLVSLQGRAVTIKLLADKEHTAVLVPHHGVCILCIRRGNSSFFFLLKATKPGLAVSRSESHLDNIPYSYLALSYRKRCVCLKNGSKNWKATLKNQAT